jgi:hypothetical protein
MTVDAIMIEAEQREKEVAAVRKLWAVTVGNHVPTVVQVSTWLALHSFDAVVEGVRIAGRKFQLMDGDMTAEHLVRFTSSVMNFRKASRAEKTAKGDA